MAIGGSSCTILFAPQTSNRRRRFPKHAAGYRRFALSDRSVGAVHTGWGLCELDAGGRVDLHVQSFEKSFFVLVGQSGADPRRPRLPPVARRLRPDSGRHEARVARPDERHGEVDRHERAVPEGRELRRRHVLPRAAAGGRRSRTSTSAIRRRGTCSGWREDDIKVDSVRTGLKKDAAKVSASMATALLVYSGISLKMLVDQRLDAALHTMFMVEYEPNANAHPHDHPLEEAYYVMHGEVEAWADDEKYVMKPGDFLWAGVGCTHAFYNRSNSDGALARDPVAAAAGAQLVSLGARLGVRGRATRAQGSRLMSNDSDSKQERRRHRRHGRHRPRDRASSTRIRAANVVITGRDAGAHGRRRRRDRRERARHRRSTSPSRRRSRTRSPSFEHVDYLALVAVDRDYNSARDYDIARARKIVTHEADRLHGGRAHAVPAHGRRRLGGAVRRPRERAAVSRARPRSRRSTAPSAA